MCDTTVSEPGFVLPGIPQEVLVRQESSHLLTGKTARLRRRAVSSSFAEREGAVFVLGRMCRYGITHVAFSALGSLKSPSLVLITLPCWAFELLDPFWFSAVVSLLLCHLSLVVGYQNCPVLGLLIIMLNSKALN